MYLNVSRSLKSVTDVKSDGLPSDGLTKISCKAQKYRTFHDREKEKSLRFALITKVRW